MSLGAGLIVLVLRTSPLLSSNKRPPIPLTLSFLLSKRDPNEAGVSPPPQMKSIFLAERIFILTFLFGDTFGFPIYRFLDFQLPRFSNPRRGILDGFCEALPDFKCKRSNELGSP